MTATAAQLLSRNTHRAPARPTLPFLGDLSLALGRAHEICGPARRTLAAMIAARMDGPIFWIAPAWQAERLNPEGACRLFAPARLTFLEPERPEALLWCMEEVLRAGVVPLVVAELTEPPGLTPVRRLHLAAETGAATGAATAGRAPLGLLLTPDQGGAAGVESRWHLAPAHRAGQQTGQQAGQQAGHQGGHDAGHGPDNARAWRLQRLRARTAPQATWEVTPQDGRFHLRPEVSAEVTVV